MFSFSEMKKLQEEEKVLIALTSKLSDQLTRLKVEELALVSMLGKQEDDFEESVASIESSSINMDDEMKSEKQEEIDLSIQNPFSQVFEEEEEEEEEEQEDDEDDDDDDNNQLKSFLRELSDKQKNM